MGLTSRGGSHREEGRPAGRRWWRSDHHDSRSINFALYSRVIHDNGKSPLSFMDIDLERTFLQKSFVMNTIKQVMSMI